MYQVPSGTLLMGNMQAEDYYLKYKEEIKKLEKINSDNLKDKIERIKKICL